jgi:hypothetical protein
VSPLITLIVPAYNQPKMLQLQAETWFEYGARTQEAFEFVIVDDCSAESVEHLGWIPMYRAMGGKLYRIDKDVPWNRGMARNLGTKMATTPWVLHVDTDHVLPAESAAQLVDFFRDENTSIPRWYRFRRFRVGAADETRKKDKVSPDAMFAEIHPHIDSYLCTPKAYWKAGGYNEDFSGVLGGGSPFLKEMEKANGAPGLLSAPLYVHTRHSVADSSEHTLPRDPEAFKRRKREIMAKRGTLRGHDPIRLPWHRVF